MPANARNLAATSRAGMLLPALLALVALLLFGAHRPLHLGAQSGGTVSYPAGWNLIGVPTATLLEQAQGPAYALGPDSTGYQQLGPGEEIAGRGAWVYFPQDITVDLGRTAAEFSRTLAPAGQYVIVGNPSATETLALGGADQAFSYDPANGYVSVTELRPGQGAFVFSEAGGEITIGKAPTGAAADDIRAVESSVSSDPTQRQPFDRLAADGQALLQVRDYATLQSAIDDVTAASEDGLRAKGSAPLPPLDSVQRDAFATIREALSAARAAVEAGQVAQADTQLDVARRAAQTAQDDAVALARNGPANGVRYLDVSPQSLAAYGALLRGSLPAIVLGLPHGDDFWAFAQALLNGQPLPAFGPAATPSPTPSPTPTPAATSTSAPAIPGVDPPSGRAGAAALVRLVPSDCPGPFNGTAIVSPEVRNSAGQLQDVDLVVGNPQPGAGSVNFSFTYPNLAPGTYTLTIFVYDRSGSVPNLVCHGSASFTITP